MRVHRVYFIITCIGEELLLRRTRWRNYPCALYYCYYYYATLVDTFIRLYGYIIIFRLRVRAFVLCL